MSFPLIDAVLHCGHRGIVVYRPTISHTMKPSTLFKQLLILTLSTSAASQAQMLIPGGDPDGPHADSVMMFNGGLQVWANELYGFTAGREVIFENAGEVTIAEKVAPKSVLVRGGGNTTWGGLGEITGETSVLKEGSGTLRMNATNSYTGGTYIKEGSVIAGGVNSFGSGIIELTGGVLDLAGHEICNDIRLSGGEIQGATGMSHRLIFSTDYTISHDTAARGIRLPENTELKVTGGATLSTEETLELQKGKALNLSGGGMFKGHLSVENDGILKLSTQGNTPIFPGSVWHLNDATVSGNLNTAPQGITTTRTAGAMPVLRLSGRNRIAGTLTLNGGVLRLSNAHASLHTETLVLVTPTSLQHDNPPGIGGKQTFLTYNRLISGTVTDYYDFFSVDEEQYELTVSAQEISITAIERTASDTTVNEQPTTPTEPETTLPGAESGESEPENDDPHLNQAENDTSTAEGDNPADLISPEAGSALSQAGMRSAWGARFTTHAFMTAVRDNSGSCDSTTWAAFYGGLTETNDQGSVPGGDTSAYGIAIGAESHLTERTQVGLALGGALGSISGESFGELDQLSLHVALYAERAFLQPNSRHCLNLYGAIGLGRTETDPGIYSGLENWHHNSFTAASRLSWEKKLQHQLIWKVYGGAEYYRGSSLRVEDENICGLSALSLELGSGIVWATKQASLYADAALTGDALRDTPTARINGSNYHTAEPKRCGIRLNLGVELHPADTQRSILLNYSFETRSDTTAHVLNAGFTRAF